MKASELIRALQQFTAEHGDGEVFVVGVAEFVGIEKVSAMHVVSTTPDHFCVGLRPDRCLEATSEAEPNAEAPKFPFDPYDKSDQEKAQAIERGLAPAPLKSPLCLPVRGMFGRWVLVQAQNARLAWTGQKWAEHCHGYPVGSVQISNFETEAEAREYATAAGLRLWPATASLRESTGGAA